MNSYKTYVENALMQTVTFDRLPDLESLMKEASEKFLNRQEKRRVKQNADDIGPIRITSEIRKEISKQRVLNKQAHQEENTVERVRLFLLYKKTKSESETNDKKCNIIL